MSNSTYSQASSADSTIAASVFSRLVSGPGPPRCADSSGPSVGIVLARSGRSVAQPQRPHPGAVRRGDALDEPPHASQVAHALDDQPAELVPLGDDRLR